MCSKSFIKIAFTVIFAFLVNSAAFAQNRNNVQVRTNHQSHFVAKDNSTTCVHGEIRVSHMTQLRSRMSDPVGHKAFSSAQAARGRDVLGCKLRKSDYGRYNPHTGRDLPVKK